MNKKLIYLLLSAVVAITAVLIIYFIFFDTDDGSDTDNHLSEEFTVEKTETVPVENGMAIIKYPNINDLPTQNTSGNNLDSSGQNEKINILNEKIKEAALSQFKNNYIEGMDKPTTYEITDTKAYLSGNIISVVSKGYIDSENAAHEIPLSYTININAETGQAYEFEDVILDFEKFAELFRKGAFELADGYDNIIDELGLENIIGQYSDKYEIYPKLYFTGDKLGIIVDVPYAAGSTASFTIEKSKLDGIISPEI